MAIMATSAKIVLMDAREAIIARMVLLAQPLVVVSTIALVHQVIQNF